MKKQLFDIKSIISNNKKERLTNKVIVDINWQLLFENTCDGVLQDANYDRYPVREKTLSFFYTFLFELQSELENLGGNWFDLNKMNEIKVGFLEYVNIQIEEGLNTGEIKSRALISSSYKLAIWRSFQSMILFWRSDISNQKEQTDIFVERTIHLVFDILMPNALDSTFDLFNFLWKNKMLK